MIALVKQVMLFNCFECKRYWHYDEYTTHKVKGLCKQDPSAKNYTSQIDNLIKETA